MCLGCVNKDIYSHQNAWNIVTFNCFWVIVLASLIYGFRAEMMSFIVIIVYFKHLHFIKIINFRWRIVALLNKGVCCSYRSIDTSRINDKELWSKFWLLILYLAFIKLIASDDMIHCFWFSWIQCDLHIPLFCIHVIKIFP